MDIHQELKVTKITSNILNQLSSIDKKITNDLLEEYRIVIKETLIGDWPNCLVHCARFAELTLAFIKVIYDKTQIDINKIHFDTLYQELTTKSKPNAEDEILLLAVPNAAKTIYTIRNKKKVVHIKAINPDFLDGTVSSAICDWILSQFVLLKCNSNPDEVSKFIHSLIDRRIPLIEEFEDGSLMILKQSTTFKDELLLALNKHSKRLTKEEIKKIIKVEYPQILNTTINELEKKKFVHVNESGIMITRLGIQEAEKIILNHSTV